MLQGISLFLFQLRGSSPRIRCFFGECVDLPTSKLPDGNFSQARLAALALASPNSRKGVAFNAALNSYRNQSKALHFVAEFYSVIRHRQSSLPAGDSKFLVESGFLFGESPEKRREIASETQRALR